jgi:hypothetical protein
MCVNVILKRKDLGLSIACYRYPDRDEEMYEHLPYHHHLSNRIFYRYPDRDEEMYEHLPYQALWS